MKPHKHSELIKQWADGAEIQYYHNVTQVWCDTRDNQPFWGVDTQYRIKPKPCDIETYDIEVGDIWLVGGYYLFVLSVTQCSSMSDGWAVQFCNQKGKHLKSTKCHLVYVKAELMFRRNGTVNRLNEI